MIISLNKDFDNKQNLAVGLRVSNQVKPPIDFLLDAKEYDIGNNTDIKRQMKLCFQLYKNEGIVGNAVDTLVEFASTETSAEETENEELNRIIEYFNENVNDNILGNTPGITACVEKNIFEFFINGNVFPYEYWERVKIPGFKKEVIIPTSIINLNPQNIEIPNESVALGNGILYFNLDYNTISLIKSDGRSNPESMRMKKTLPQSLIRKIKRAGNAMSISLDPRYVSHIKRKGRDYNGWGIPFLTRAFSAVAMIKKLRKLDEATIEGMVNILRIFKIGTDEFPATPGRLSAFASLLSEQKAATDLVWSHDIDVKTEGPDGKVLSFKDKYVEAYNELKRALGVCPGLLGENDDVSYEDLLAMAERLETVRFSIKKWIDKSIYKKIAIENGYKEIYPKSKMSRMKLYNDAVIKTQVMNFYDRGLIGPETALSEAGYNYKGVVESKKKTKKDVEDGLFDVPQLPFSQQDNRTGDVEDRPETTVTKPKVNIKTRKKVINK